jgi:uncharacterized protein
MKIIDFHTHVFPDNIAERAIAVLTQNAKNVKPYCDGKLSSLRSSMRKAGISASVLLPIATKPSQVKTINAGCKTQTAEDIIPFGTLHPETVNAEEELDILKADGIKGVKLHPEYQDFYIAKREYFHIYEAISASGLILVMHTGKDPGPFTCDHALPEAIKTVCCNFPKLKLVAAHMGGWQLWRDVEETIIDLPIFFDTAATRKYLPKGDFTRMAKKHGMERIIFGTDSPWYSPDEDIKWIDSMKISSEEKEMILHKNAENLLKS